MATKKHLISVIADKLPDFETKDVTEAIDLIFDYLSDELKNSNRIEIRGFGSFSVRNRKKPLGDEFYKVVYYRASKETTKFS